MRCRIISIFVFLVTCMLFQACSTGVFTKLDSTAPSRTPVFVGMMRHEAEMHLGVPIYVSRVDETRYSGLYEYETELGTLDQLCLDAMDVTTLGLGRLIVTPMDRNKGRKHLVSVMYEMEDGFSAHDRIVDIKSKVELNFK